MAETELVNGRISSTISGAIPQPPSERVVFKIGGQDIEVPALSFDVLERRKEQVQGLDPDLSILDYAALVLDIISCALEPYRPELTLAVLRRACTWQEARELPTAMSNLMIVSGFTAPVGEEVAAVEESPGTGTSTLSSPSLEPEGFAAEIQGG